MTIKENFVSLFRIFENYNKETYEKDLERSPIAVQLLSEKLYERKFGLIDWRFHNVPLDLIKHLFTQGNEIVKDLDFHRPYIDNLFFIDEERNEYFREADLIDVWFDSGSMPYAQWHYPFENKENFDPETQKGFPADFIAEGVDQAGLKWCRGTESNRRRKDFQSYSRVFSSSSQTPENKFNSFPLN